MGMVIRQLHVMSCRLFSSYPFFLSCSPLLLHKCVCACYVSYCILISRLALTFSISWSKYLPEAFFTAADMAQKGGTYDTRHRVDNTDIKLHGGKRTYPLTPPCLLRLSGTLTRISSTIYASHRHRRDRFRLDDCAASRGGGREKYSGGGWEWEWEYVYEPV
jgi:hypothetical protein